ncbi:MAG: hypothetical protein ACRC35_07355 [Angustibacter sp.]
MTTDVGPRPGSSRLSSRLRTWLAPAVPLRRIRVLRVVVYLFVIVDVVLISRVGFSHGDTPGELYRPLILRSALNLPAPNPVYVRVLAVVIVCSALVAACGRLPRLAGWVCFLGMLDWLSNVFSYGKVDHDHLALVVALAVLPTVKTPTVGTSTAAAAQATDPRRDDVASEAAGWALRCIQLAVVATYLLSVVAKVRFGGWGWPTGAIFTWAFIRRGTALADLMLQVPWLVAASQWALVVLETASPALLFLRGRPLRLLIVAFAGFHLATWVLIGIHFLPLAVCLLAFLPVERLVRRRYGSSSGEGREGVIADIRGAE